MCSIPRYWYAVYIMQVGFCTSLSSLQCNREWSLPQLILLVGAFVSSASFHWQEYKSFIRNEYVDKFTYIHSPYRNCNTYIFIQFHNSELKHKLSKLIPLFLLYLVLKYNFLHYWLLAEWLFEVRVGAVQASTYTPMVTKINTNPHHPPSPLSYTYMLLESHAVFKRYIKTCFQWLWQQPAADLSLLYCIKIGIKGLICNPHFPVTNQTFRLYIVQRWCN
jgi:hypothetical protein